MEKRYVPVYYPEGVTIGKATISDDGRFVEIEFNEGASVGKKIAKGLIGLTSINRIDNPEAPQ